MWPNNSNLTTNFITDKRSVTTIKLLMYTKVNCNWSQSHE